MAEETKLLPVLALLHFKFPVYPATRKQRGEWIEGVIGAVNVKRQRCSGEVFYRCKSFSSKIHMRSVLVTCVRPLICLFWFLAGLFVPASVYNTTHNLTHFSPDHCSLNPCDCWSCFYSCVFLLRQLDIL